jgi:hypothetical protein
MYINLNVAYQKTTYFGAGRTAYQVAQQRRDEIIKYAEEQDFRDTPVTKQHIRTLKA